MFCGIVSHIGKIERVDNTPTGKRFWVQTHFEQLVIGESISVDGVCLTVTEHKDGLFCCDVSPETLCKSIAANYQAHDLVNVERAMRLSDRVGGHLVSGHVDEVATVAEQAYHGDFLCLTLQPNSLKSLRYVSSKGSVTLNGVSLTVNEVESDRFSVMLVPQTLDVTNLKNVLVGRGVNVEYDMLAKMIEKQIENRLSNV